MTLLKLHLVVRSQLFLVWSFNWLLMLTFVLCCGPDVDSERSSDREGHPCRSIAYDPVCVEYAFLVMYQPVGKRKYLDYVQHKNPFTILSLI